MIKEVIIAIFSTILGTAVGCFLNSFTLSKGKIIVESENFRIITRCIDSYRTDGEGVQHYGGNIINKVIISFDLLVINKKQTTCGIHSCKVYLKDKNGKKWYLTDLTEQVTVCCDNVDLLNIPGRTTRNKKIEKECNFLWERDLKGSVICLEYKINGKKKQYSHKVGEVQE